MSDDLLEHAHEPDQVHGSATSDLIDAPVETNDDRTIGRRVVDRVLRRPSAWLERDWTVDRLVRLFITASVLTVTTAAAVASIHPRLIFTVNTPTGGDMGAHVMGPAFLRDHLLPSFQLSGWSNYWYAGLPMYRFYMVVPALMIVALNIVLPYGIAFKIIAVSGIVTLPLSCWAFGRLAGFRYPVPELFAVGGLLLLFDESYAIYGGNLKSTMAGEFSFSISLSLAMLGLGLFANGMRTGKYRSWAAIVLALACLSHGIVLIFVLVAVSLMWLVWMDLTRFVYGITVGITTFLLAAFWVVPFLFNHASMTDMKYGFRPEGPTDSFWDMFFPLTTFFDIFITTFAIIGFVASIARRNLMGAWLGITTIAFVALVYITRESLPVIGLLWNPRLLPFVYLLRYLLMMVGLVEAALIVHRAATSPREPSARATSIVLTSTAVVVCLAVLFIELMFFRAIPERFGGAYTTQNGKSVYSWGIGDWRLVSLSPTSEDAIGSAWANYNFTGYESRSAYGEYRSLVLAMKDLGEDPAKGCGRAMWENNGDNGVYGTTMALMLLPHWTDGCIASMEGLFFEASGTTPYHFVTAAAASASSSNPVRGLRYDNTVGDKAVPYLETLGVKYLMVWTEKAKAEADLQPKLSLVRQVGPWNVYEVADTTLVEPLTVQPVVVNSRPGDPRERNLELGMSWFQHRDEWAAIPADGGPTEWQRIDVAPDLARRNAGQVDIVQPSEPITSVPLPPVTVSNVQLGEQDLRFSVDQIGVPVVVKISYFPNWKVEGAEGPWRIAPNLMVVVPTSQDVRLSFERSWIDVLAYVLTFIGIALLFVWRRLGDVHHATELPSLFEPVNGEDDLDDLDHDATRPMVRDPMVRDDDDLLVLTPSRDPDDSKDPPDSV